tara:strand:- start:355 stop:558 length:204 start_codon:yes stop_codon:yes gene_type:complete
MSELRLAGTELGLDLREGLGSMNLDNALRFRRDKLIPRSLQSAMAPERSEPYFSMTGSYQPEVAFGL